MAEPFAPKSGTGSERMHALRWLALRPRRFLVALALFVGAPASAAAQEMAVPVDLQIPLLIKILSFDRNLGDRTVVLGVLYQRKYRASANVANEVRDAVKRLPRESAGGRPVRAVPIDLDDTPSLASALERHGVTVLYVAPLRSADLRALAAATRSSQVITVTGVPAYVETGLAIGVGVRGERPEIVINLVASRAEGADLGAQLLKLARIVP
jgi:hypothetical protein